MCQLHFNVVFLKFFSLTSHAQPTLQSSAAAATIAAKTFAPCCTRSCPAPAALVAAADAAVLAALLALEMTDERLLDTLAAEELREDVAAPLASTVLLEPAAVLEPLPAAVVEAHTAAVCVNVTPAGLQMPLAYLSVASWSALSQTLATQQVTPAMKLLAEQMHFGSRLQLAGMEFSTQEYAQVGRPASD